MRRSETLRRHHPAKTTGNRASAASGPLSDERSPRPYRPPRLEAYGRLVDLTQMNGSVQVDTGFGLGPQT